MSSYSEANARDNGGEKQHQQLVCVTGAGGFIGSWVVKVLLLRGYRVRGTARDPADHKNAHLHALEGAEEGLSLCRVDLLDLDGLRGAFSGYHGVFHVASPVSNNDPELMLVAVEGTRNVINAAADMGVQRVVFTSSYGAVHMDPNRSPDVVMDETCWSDYEFCKLTENLYCCAKMMAEITATKEAAKRGLELAVVVPSMTIGPPLQQAINLSITHIAGYMMGTRKFCPNAVAAYTDVRDVAHAHVLAYEARSGRRYLCIGAVLHRAHLLQLLRDLFPHYPVTTKCQDDGKPMAKPYRFSNQRLTDLGLESLQTLTKREFLPSGLSSARAHLSATGFRWQPGADVAHASNWGSHTGSRYLSRVGSIFSRFAPPSSHLRFPHLPLTPSASMAPCPGDQPQRAAPAP